MNDENFDVKIPPLVSSVDDDTVIVTDIDGKSFWEKSSLDFEQKRHTYSRYLGGEESNSNNTLTLSDINDYADNPQNSLDDIKKINSIVKQYINKDDIIGKVYESVQIYTNSQYSLRYPTLINDKNKNKNKLEKTVKPLVESFNRKIDIE